MSRREMTDADWRCLTDQDKLLVMELNEVCRKAIEAHVIEHAMRIPAMKITNLMDRVNIEFMERGKFQIAVTCLEDRRSQDDKDYDFDRLLGR